MTPARKKALLYAIQRRQRRLTVLLDNVHDPHNIGAVMRTCESVGIADLHILYTDHPMPNFKKLGKRTTAGTHRWVNVHLHDNLDRCMQYFRKHYDKIYATHLGEKAKSIYETDFTEKVVLVFGNEAKGVSQELLKQVDGNILIPQMGMTQSLNISVACAVTLYEALRQRQVAGIYDQSQFTPAEEQTLLEHFVERSKVLRGRTYALPFDYSSTPDTL